MQGEWLGSAFVGAVVALATSYVNDRLIRRSSLEKIRDDDVLEIIQVIEALFENSEFYFGGRPAAKDQSGGRLEAVITARLHHLNGLCVELFDDAPEFSPATDREMRSLHRKVTSGTFGEGVLQDAPEVLREIYIAGWALQRGVRRRRRKLPRASIFWS